MARKLRCGLIAGVLCLVISAGILQAASITYSDQAKRIKAGVLVQPNWKLSLDGTLNPVNRPDPYLFYVLDQRQDIKPGGWELYNPYAPSNVTAVIVERWLGRYQLGQTVRKDMGCYWEVPTDTAPNILAEYDVLFLSAYGNLGLDRKEKEALRKFVDNGGVLWIERRNSTQIVNFFIDGMLLTGGGAGLTVPAQADPTAATHSLVNRPFTLLWNDIMKLGPGRTADGIGRIQLSPAAFRYFMPVVIRGGDMIVSAAQYGSGFILVTAESIGQAVSDPLGSAGVTGKYEGLLMASQPEDLKFAYNIISWGSEHSTAQKSARHTGYSYSEIGMLPLSLLWEFKAGNLGPNDAAPAIINDMVFYVSNMNGNFLHAFDLSPIRDRDGDGNPDDGIPDYSQGMPYDELWRKSLGAPASSPTVAYVPKDFFPDSTSTSYLVPAVFVVTKSGQVIGFDASMPDPQPQPFFDDPMHAPAPFDNDFAIPAPTYVDGTLYVGDGHGFLRAQRFFPPVGMWSNPLGATRRGPSHSPTVGYFYDSTTGVTELVAYASRSMMLGVAQGGISCYPIRAMNEILTPVNPTASPGLYRTRATNAQILPESLSVYWTVDGVNITFIHQDGVGAVTVQPMGRLLIEPTTFAGIPAGAAIIADYELDYSNPTMVSRQEIVPHFKALAGIVQEVGPKSAPAASKKDILYYADDWSSFYAAKESGRGSPPLAIKWRWCAQDEAASVALGLPAGTPLEPIGSPALGDDTVYFAANAGEQGYLLAFRADPAISIRLGTPLKQGTRVEVRQWDTINGPAGGGPDTEPQKYTGTVVGDTDRIPPETMFLVDYDTGLITFLNLRNRNGRIMTLSQNMTVVYTPRPYNEDDIVEEMEVPISAFDPNQKLNNLMGFIRLENSVRGGRLRITSAPMITGSVLYAGCEDGILTSVDLRGSFTPSSVKQQQLVLDPNPANSAIRASVAGSHGLLTVATPTGLGVYHNPVTLVTDANRLVELSSSGSVIWSLDSTTTYNTTSDGNPDLPIYGAIKTPFNRPAVARRAPAGGYIVADTGNNRIVHIDKSGMVLWQVMDFADPNELLPAGLPLTLNKPTDVSMWVSYDSGSPYPIYSYLIADSGNFRVLEIAAVYDAVEGSYRNILRQTTRAISEGKQYRFTTARLIYVPTASGYAPKVICSVMNADDQSSLDGTAGSLVQVDWTTGAVDTVISGLPIDTMPIRRLSNPRFFNRQYISNTEYYDLVIDSLGIHVLRTVSGVPQGIRSFYTGDNREPVSNALIPLAASYAQIMPNGRILVTNRATGTVAGGSFLGEVFELQPHGTDPGRYERVKDSALRREIRQPSSAERLIQ